MPANPATPPSPGADLVEWSTGWLRRHFRPEVARGLSAVIEVELTGSRSGAFCLQIEDGRIKSSRGRDAGPAARLTLSGDDWCDVLEGRANAEMLAMAGRIRIEGDLSLALKMRSLFRRSA